MRIFAISDLHLTSEVDKPMDIFGEKWIGHWEKIKEDWNNKVSDDDVVLVAGDTSWGMRLSEAVNDLKQIDALPGKKIIIRGNHDYWWSAYSKIKALPLTSIVFVQNDATTVGDYVFCGTRGWTVGDREGMTQEDGKIFDREIIRLELSLKEAVAKAEGREIIGLIHYPPFNAKYEKSPFTELFEKYGVKRVVYGHLHGKQAKNSYKSVHIGNVIYYLTSCDFLENKLLEL